MPVVNSRQEIARYIDPKFQTWGWNDYVPLSFERPEPINDIALSEQITDPMWRMPLFAPYKRLLDSRVADLNNVSAGGFGGAITAALYLQAFVPDDVPWAHFDMMAWNNSSRPGRPEGGEAQAAPGRSAANASRCAWAALSM